MAHRHEEITIRSCPGQALLESWIKLSLPEGESHSIREHVQHCSSCQLSLEDCTQLKGWRATGFPLPNPSSISLSELAERIHRLQMGSLSTQNSGSDTLLEREVQLPIHVGRYSILRQLGEGGMAVVYEAWDPKMQRNIALKLLRAGKESSDDRLFREVHAFVQIQDEHVVSVYDVEKTQDQAWFTMEVIDGPSLAQIIRQQNSPTISKRIELIKQAAKGLSAVHRRGIIHRDVKPSNILTNSQGKVKISDFGLVRWSEGPSLLTQTGVALGTPVYMSPEQAEGKSVDHRTDIYSLGVSLYEILTGVIPFQGTPLRILEQIRLDEPIPVRKLNENIPIDLETICHKAMAKAPDQRYQTMDSLHADLENWLAGKPILARPVGHFGKLVRWVKREPKLATAIGTTLLALSTGLSVALWQWKQVREERETAERRYKDAYDAVESMIAISDQPVMNLPGMQPARNELLTKSITYLDRYTKERKNDPIVRLQYFKTINRLISLRQTLMGNQPSLDYALEMLPEVRRALATEANKAEVRAECLRTLSQLAYRYLAMNKLEESAALCAEAQTWFRDETDQEMRLHTNILNTQGLIAKYQNKFTEASGFFQQAVHTLKDLIASGNTDDITRISLEETYYNLALLHMAREEWEPASTYLEQCLEVLFEIVKTKPTQLRKEKITLTIFNLCGCYFFMNQPEKAEKAVLTMYDEFLQLAVENPNFTTIQVEASKLVQSLINAYIFLGKFQEAKERIPALQRIFQRLDKLSPILANFPNIPRWFDQVVLHSIHVHQFELEAARKDLESIHAVCQNLKKQMGEASSEWKADLENYYLSKAFVHYLSQETTLAVQCMEKAIPLADRSKHNYLLLCKAVLASDENLPSESLLYDKALEELRAYFRFNYIFPINHHMFLLCYMKASQFALKDGSLSEEQKLSRVEAYRKQALEHLSLATKSGLYNNTKWQAQLKRNELPCLLADNALYNRLIEPPKNKPKE